MRSIANIHERNKERLDKFSTITKLMTVEGNRTITREVIVYNFKGLLEICRYSNQPKANAVIDFLWEVADDIRQHGMYLSHQFTCYQPVSRSVTNNLNLRLRSFF